MTDTSQRHRPGLGKEDPMEVTRMREMSFLPDGLAFLCVSSCSKCSASCQTVEVH